MQTPMAKVGVKAQPNFLLDSHVLAKACQFLGPIAWGPSQRIKGKVCILCCDIFCPLYCQTFRYDASAFAFNLWVFWLQCCSMVLLKLLFWVGMIPMIACWMKFSFESNTHHLLTSIFRLLKDGFNTLSGTWNCFVYEIPCKCLQIFINVTALVPVKFGFIQLQSMEPEMIVPSTIIDHVE